MRIPLLAALVILAAYALIGCGGSGDDHSTSISTFNGHFAGTWSATDGDVGTADITVANSGDVSGQIIDTTASLTGTVTGHIRANGVFTGSYVYPGNNPISGTGTFSISNDNQTLTGIVTSGNNSATYTLTRQ